jgi:hypothetical protein
MSRSVSTAANGPPLHATGLDAGAEGMPILLLMLLAGAWLRHYNFQCSPTQDLSVEDLRMNHLRRYAWAAAASLLVSATLAAVPGAQKADKDAKDNPDSKRPQVRLKAQPVIAMAPARVVLTAELVGGANDFEEFYCAAIEWEWGDGTQSESSSDCAPYEAGKSEIKRRYTVEHVFRAGAYRVMFHLKRRDKSVGAASVNIQIRPGLRDGIE